MQQHNPNFFRHEWRKRIRFPMRAIYCFIMLLNTHNVAAELSGQEIEHVKAAFVLNIARFVSWPPESFEEQSARLLLCVRKGGISSQTLEMLEDETVGGYRVVVNQIDSFVDTRSCNVLFIANDELEKYTKEISVDVNRPLLTILDITETEVARSVRSNVLVTLIRKGSRIGFEINLDKARHSGLRMSSELLKLATIIDDGS